MFSRDFSSTTSSSANLFFFPTHTQLKRTQEPRLCAFSHQSHISHHLHKCSLCCIKGLEGLYLYKSECDSVAHLVICVLLVMWLWTMVAFPLQAILWGGSLYTSTLLPPGCSLHLHLGCLSRTLLVMTDSLIFLYIIIHFFFLLLLSQWSCSLIDVGIKHSSRHS